MSAPVHSLPKSGSIAEAIGIMHEHNIGHLITAGQDAAITRKELLIGYQSALPLVLAEIEAATTARELRVCRDRLEAAIIALVNTGMSADSITRQSSRIADAILCRIISLVHKELGAAYAYAMVGWLEAKDDRNRPSQRIKTTDWFMPMKARTVTVHGSYVLLIALIHFTRWPAIPSVTGTPWHVILNGAKASAGWKTFSEWTEVTEDLMETSIFLI